MRTSAAPRVERALVLGCLLAAALVVSLLQPVGRAEAAAKVPVAPQLPTAIEALASYQGAQNCDPVARSGPTRLKTLLAQTYGSGSFGITRACTGSTATSEHMEGRALDWMISGKSQRANANAFLDWLLAKDAAGNKYAMARRMGLMYIIWDDKMFRFYDTGRGWSEYSNCLSTQSAGYDTSCHRDHVHFSFSWDGAAALTSYWSGEAVTAPSCPSVGSAGTAPDVPKTGLEFVALPPARVLDTAKALGVSARCRLSQPSWSGDNRRIDVQVAGRGGVPENGAVAVALSLQVRDPNAPTKLLVEGAGSPWKVLRASTTGINVHGLGASIIPVGANGRVSLTLPTGAADVIAVVLGYYRSPDATTTRFHVTQPEGLLDTVKSESKFQADESRTLDAAALADLPASTTSVALAVTVSGGTKAGGVTVFGANDEPPAGRATSVYAPKAQQRTNLTMATLSPSGTVLIRNAAKGKRHVRIDLLGWFAPSSVVGGSQFVPLKPKEVIDTTESKGISGAMNAGRTAKATVTGVGGVPASDEASVTAVALQTTMLDVSANGVLVAHPAGSAVPDTRSASPRSGLDHTALVIAPIKNGRTSLTSTGSGFGVRSYAVGYWYQP